MLHHLDVILGTVERPDRRMNDPIAGRERSYRRDLDGHRWLCVVVDFDVSPARVVTAFVDIDPFGERP